MSKSDDSGDENQPSITESDSEITDDEEEIEKEMEKTPVNPQQLAFTPPTPRLITSKSPLHPEVSTSPDTPSISRSTLLHTHHLLVVTGEQITGKKCIRLYTRNTSN